MHERMGDAREIYNVWKKINSSDKHTHTPIAPCRPRWARCRNIQWGRWVALCCRVSDAAASMWSLTRLTICVCSCISACAGERVQVFVCVLYGAAGTGGETAEMQLARNHACVCELCLVELVHRVPLHHLHLSVCCSVLQHVAKFCASCAFSLLLVCDG